MTFHASASEVEFFSAQVKRGKIEEDELAQQWKRFTQQLQGLLDGAGIEFLDFEGQYREELTDELAGILRRENRAA
jgi:hypothetical protein